MENYKKIREERKRQGAKAAGTIHGNVSNAATIYGEEKFHASREYGFAVDTDLRRKGQIRSMISSQGMTHRL